LATEESELQPVIEIDAQTPVWQSPIRPLSLRDMNPPNHPGYPADNVDRMLKFGVTFGEYGLICGTLNTKGT